MEIITINKPLSEGELKLDIKYRGEYPISEQRGFEIKSSDKDVCRVSWLTENGGGSRQIGDIKYTEHKELLEYIYSTAMNKNSLELALDVLVTMINHNK